MSFASMTMIIIIFINLFVFLVSWDSKSTEINSPVLALLQLIVGNGSYQINWTSLIMSMLDRIAIVAILCPIILVISYSLGGPGSILGSNFSTFHVMTIIAIAIFAGFTLIPNLPAFPAPLNMVVEVFFGMMIIMSVFGLFRGE